MWAADLCLCLWAWSVDTLPVHSSKSNWSSSCSSLSHQWHSFIYHLSNAFPWRHFAKNWGYSWDWYPRIPVFMKLPVWLFLRPLDFLHFVFHLLSVLTIIPCSSSFQQKRDIQLLKAYMRAIRSVNPNLQNLEETIEYNEILEWVSFRMWNHLFHVLVLSPEERRAGKWQRGRVRRGLGWGHCSSDAGMKNKRQRRRGSPSAPVEGGWKGKLSQELVGYPHAQNTVLKQNIVPVFREFTIQRRECKNPGKWSKMWQKQVKSKIPFSSGVLHSS